MIRNFANLEDLRVSNNLHQSHETDVLSFFSQKIANLVDNDERSKHQWDSVKREELDWRLNQSETSKEYIRSSEQDNFIDQ
jgi:hypothetical protein